MSNILQIIQCIILLSHPLEPVSTKDVDLQEFPHIILKDKFYTASRDGYVKNIIINENSFQVTINYEDRVDMVYSGLTELSVKVNDKIKPGDLIGRDSSISDETRIVTIIYNNSTEFPQFNNNKLIFKTNKGSKVYMMADAQRIFSEYDPYGNGLYSKYILSECKNSVVYYIYLQNIINMNNTMIRQGDAVAISGNSGDTMFPSLGIIIDSNEFGNCIRVIYAKIW